jgi:hypothetical protein
MKVKWQKLLAGTWPTLGDTVFNIKEIKGKTVGKGRK